MSKTDASTKVGHVSGWSACPCSYAKFFRAQTRKISVLKPVTERLSNTVRTLQPLPPTSRPSPTGPLSPEAADRTVVARRPRKKPLPTRRKECPPHAGRKSLPQGGKKSLPAGEKTPYLIRSKNRTACTRVCRRATSPRLSSTRARRPASISGRWPSRRSPSRGTLEGPACHHHHVAVRAKRVVPAHEGELIADSTLNLIAPREPATRTSKGRTQGMYLAKQKTDS